MDSNYLKEFIFKCPICYELYSNVHKPLILPCGHTVCSECFESIKKQSEEDDEEEYHSAQPEDEFDVSLESDEEESEEEEEGEEEESGTEEEESNESVETVEEQEDENEILTDEQPENLQILNQDQNLNEIGNKEITEIEENLNKNPKVIRIKCSICRKKMKINDDEILLNKNVISVINSIDSKSKINKGNLGKVFCKMCRVIDIETNHLSKSKCANHGPFLIELNQDLFNIIKKIYIFFKCINTHHIFNCTV